MTLAAASITKELSTPSLDRLHKVQRKSAKTKRAESDAAFEAQISAILAGQAPPELLLDLPETASLEEEDAMSAVLDRESAVLELKFGRHAEVSDDDAMSAALLAAADAHQASGSGSDDSTANTELQMTSSLKAAKHVLDGMKLKRSLQRKKAKKLKKSSSGSSKTTKKRLPVTTSRPRGSRPRVPISFTPAAARSRNNIDIGRKRAVYSTRKPFKTGLPPPAEHRSHKKEVGPDTLLPWRDRGLGVERQVATLISNLRHLETLAKDTFTDEYEQSLAT
jgi:hypothetical protein